MEKYNAFYPGKVWLDTDGNRIQAHAPQVMRMDGKYFLYGEDKGTVGTKPGVWHAGVRLYSSDDLYNWKNEGTILHPSDDPKHPLYPMRIMDRPHILYNKKNSQYVMWLKLAGTGDNTREDWSDQYAGVAVSNSIYGPFELVRTFHPLGMMFGDFDLIKSEQDEKAYVCFSRSYTEMVIADLTEDYMDVMGYYSCHFPNVQPPYIREAPTHFVRKHKHYFMTSGTTGYYPNPTEAAVAPLIHGPYRLLENPHVNDVHETSFDSQVCCVIKHPDKKDLYIAIGDRWFSDLPDKRPDVWDYYRAMFSDDPDEFTNYDKEPFEDYLLPDTSKGTYVWLPIRFENDQPYIEWREEWRIEDYE